MDRPSPDATRGDSRRAFGAAGERITAHYLRERGYRIVDRNVRLASGEIDLVADDHGCLVLVEVRLRRGASAGQALESIARRKQARLRQLMSEYCSLSDPAPLSARIDVVAISLDRDGRLRDIVLVQNAVEGE